MRADSDYTKPKDDAERLGWRIAEFAALISMSPQHVYRMAKQGKLSVIYMGDAPIVPRSEAVRLGLITA